MSPPGAAPFNALKACRHGQMLYNVNDQYIGRSLDLYGEFSEAEVDLFRQLIRPSAWVLDVGANIGTHALFFARQVGPAGRVLAFEPQRIVFQTLCANMALNSVTNAWCYPYAVGTKPGEIVVPLIDYHRTNNFGGLGLGPYREGEPVPVVTLDGFNLPRCDLIKIDVEGMERDVLAGAVNLVERCKPLLYVENDRAEKSDELIRFIDGLGYVLYWHRPPMYNPNNYFGNPFNAFEGILSLNMLGVHRGVPLTVQGAQPVAVPPR